MSFKLKLKSKKDKEFISINKINTNALMSTSNSNKKSSSLTSTTHKKRQQSQNHQQQETVNDLENTSNNIKQQSHTTTQLQKQRQHQQHKSNNQRFREFLQLFHYRLNTPPKTSQTKSKAKPNNSIVLTNHETNTHIKKEPMNVNKSNETPFITLKTCILCLSDESNELMYKLRTCEHEFCEVCLSLYLKYQINDSRVTLQCPQCSQQIHPNDIQDICLKSNNVKLVEKYEEFMVRRVLVSIVDVRWCPAPDCTYAVIATGCANCPQLTCQRENCNTSFCYHCKQHWHPNLTCDDAALLKHHQQQQQQQQQQQSSSSSSSESSSITSKKLLKRSNSHISILNTSTSLSNALSKDELKYCPKCKAPIVKMDDGSCNHITCAICGCEFCWLCMKEISDLHYLSPSGCTFWGKKPWSRKKKIMWQLGTLIGAPIGIALVAVVAIPGILIGLPIWTGRKVYAKLKSSTNTKRNLLVVGTVAGSILVAPIVAALCVGIGVPILLAYIYGVVPISLCRSGMCGVTKNNNGGVKLSFDEDNTIQTHVQVQQVVVAATQTTAQDLSKKPSITNLVLNSSQTKLNSIKINEKTINDTCGSILNNHSNFNTCKDTQSIGTSLSASFNQIDRIMMYDDCCSQNTDRDSTSNRALAGSINQQTHQLHITKNKSNKISFNDNVSITTISEKFSISSTTQSVNPSVVALAGSLKEGDSMSQHSKSPSLEN